MRDDPGHVLSTPSLTPVDVSSVGGNRHSYISGVATRLDGHVKPFFSSCSGHRLRTLVVDGLVSGTFLNLVG